MAVLEAKMYNSSHERLFTDEKPKDISRYNPALNRKGSGMRHSHTDT